MTKEQIILRLKTLTEPSILDPHMDDDGRGLDRLVDYIKQLIEDIEDDLDKEFKKHDLIGIGF